MTLQEKVYDLSAIWRHCAFVFPHFHRCGVNWDEVYREFIPRALATETDREHALLMMEFVNLLGDGHTDISLNREITDRIGYFPFPLDFADGVYHIQGEKVLHIDGIPMDELVERAKRYVYHVGGFLPRLRYLWDENASQYIRYETMYFAIGLLKRRILEYMVNAPSD